MSTTLRHRRRRPFAAALAVAVAATFLPVFTAAATPAVAPAPTSPCGPLDVTFVIDDTGSMGPALTNIKNELGNIATAVQTNSGNDYKLGLVTFKDNITVHSDLTALNLATVTPQINALTATGGNNEPEASDEAVNTAVNNLPATGRPQVGNFAGVWRSNATKMVILVTDARPGGFDDAFAAADQANAHLRAVQAATKGIKISSVYVQTSTAYPVIPTIMQDYATTTGGTYAATPASGAGAGTAILDALKNCRKTDVFIKDAAADTGVAPHALNPIWTSPDIKVCASLPPCASINPVVGATNYVVVTLNNPGPYGSGASTGHVEVSYTAQGGAALWPTDWVPVGSSATVTVAPGSVQVPVLWAGVPGPGHFCLLARWISATDPMTSPELPGSNTLTNTRNNNNIAWHNVDTIKLKPGVGTTHPFTLGNPVADRLTTDLVFTQPGKPFAGGPGTVVVDLGKVLAERWRQSGQKGVGVRPVGDTQVEIVDPRQATLQGLVIEPKERLETAVTFTATDAAAGGEFVFRMSQSDGKDDLGGVEFQLSTEQ
ncbi:VWA domain-containing protein [Amycolatopsis sp. NBC_00348]|uniref:vWA domain-containing protein n=1 Tax=Amycolatopsis sp. NBC_00348 TaxID=2975956 RepID=UPI002E266203